MRTVLVVANQTLGGPRLIEQLRARIQGDEPHRFLVVVPETRPEHYAMTWSIEGMPLLDPALTELHELEQLAHERAQGRLDRTLDHIRSLGGEGEGWLGDPDPQRAVERAVEEHDVDEILLSTLPPGISRWLRLDLPSRLERSLDVPITVVEAAEEDTVPEG